MDMITASEAAIKWNVTPRFVQMLCKKGKIVGAVKRGKIWMIPANGDYPYDREVGAERDMGFAMPKQSEKSMYADITNIYNEPGKADSCTASLASYPDLQLVFAAGIAYLRGEIDEACRLSAQILAQSSDAQSRISGGMRMGLCAVWKGDVELWRESRRIICEESRKREGYDAIAELALSAVGGTVQDLSTFPEWFQIGDFTQLPPDMMASAKVLYAKYLYAMIYAVASRQIDFPGLHGFSSLGLLPYVLEPMISQAYADRSLISEASMRLLCAIVYHFIGQDERAGRHLDRALEITIPDGFYGILAEYRRGLGNLLDDRLNQISPQALARVRNLHKEMREGWSKINEVVLKRRIATNLTAREHEVARLAVFGFTNPEIAEKLGISVAAVKQTVRSAMFKGHVEKRTQLVQIL